MKRLIAILCLVFMLGTMMSACKSDKKDADVDLKKVYQEIKSEVKLPEMVDLSSADQLDRRYGITEDMAEDFAGGVDSTGTLADEIVLIRAKDEDSVSKIEEKLNTRLASKLNQNRTYNPEQAAIIEKCRVETDGLYVSLIVSAEAEKITEIFKKSIS